MVHRPASIAEAAAGRARLAYEELLSVHILHRRANALAREHRAGVAMTNRRELTSRLKASLPFDLTGAQTRSLREIVADMTSARRMHRLLQGDVGSGKTIVALFASLLAMENGFQAAVMAPTELLAEQHHRTFARLLEPLGIQPLLVTGRQGARERREAAEVMARPRRCSSSGTHALVSRRPRSRGSASRPSTSSTGSASSSARRSRQGRGSDVLLMTATPSRARSRSRCTATST
jgi:ATP-dependent DNA helicase RecG